MQFEIHQSFPESIENEWNLLLDESITHVPFLRYEYMQAWWHTRGGGEWSQADLLIVTAHDNERLVGIAPLFFAVNRQAQPALLLLGSIEISDYLDLIVRPDDLQRFTNGLLPFLASATPHAWQVLDLYNILDSSPTLAALEASAAQMGWAFIRETLQHSPYIPLPGDWETYLEGIDKKQRHEIRRKMRRFESAEVPTRWVMTQDAATLDEDIQTFLHLMEQDDDKKAFLTPSMREHMALTTRCAFENGCLHLTFLEIDGEKAAGYLSFDYLNRLWIYNSGIDWRFSEYSPGWVLLGYLLKWANENHRTEFDFMRGDEQYKYRFGAIDRFVMRALISRA